ncbi:MFS transporter [Phenylobacterium sp.]|uniref:MFS transporter n=1 Tax=Phenylobacterium sp. TaxID=1871053 RepID=UPI0025F44171|nr:MFS transporter [Phenylobacterium sp.]MBX3482837.1 MFS transporter [Phenylobacterium sp.]MCW5759407.1 MFS transporter [Phenylobacterium sp.]
MTAAAIGGSGAGQRAVAIFAVLSAMTLVVLDAGVANVALPALGDALGAAPDRAMLVVTAYQAGLVMALLPAGALGERFGRRRVFALGVGVFAGASALCALAPSLPWLVAARLLQGLGGAAIMALGVALLRLSVPAGRLGAAIGWNALTVALASAAAPSLGAAILSVADWPALFAVNLPLAAATLAASRALPSSPPSATAPDAISMGLNAAALGALVLAAESALTAPRMAVALLAGGAGGLTLLMRREAPKAEPLVPLDLLRSEPFRLSVVASVCCFAAQSAGLLALPFLLQHGFGRSPLEAGLLITVWPLSVAIAAVAAGRLSDRLPTAWLCALGGALLSAGLAGAGAGPPEIGPARLVPFLALAGIGFGLFQSPNNRNLLLSAPAGRSGAAGGMQGTARVTGQTVGSVGTALLFSLAAPVAAPQIALMAAAAFALAAGLVSLFRILA